jgi:hypothetical protein
MGMQLKPNETNTSTGVDHKKTLLGLATKPLPTPATMVSGLADLHEAWHG